MDKSALAFFKIDEHGLLSPASSGNTGYWTLDSLVANDNSWAITIPQDLRPRAYVLRHEVVNLDTLKGKAQHFPQCINIEVTGNGAQVPPQGIVGTKLYRADDSGIVFGPELLTRATQRDPPPVELQARSSPRGPSP